MMGWIDVVAIVVALLFAALGVWRGFLREIMVTLAGIVLGVFLGSLWADALGGTAVESQGLWRLLGLLGVVLLLGYGSAIFMRRQPILWWQRLAGGVVGLFNGVLLILFSFQIIQDYFVREPSFLDGSVTYTIATTYLAYTFLVIAGIAAAVVLGALLARLARFIIQLAQAVPAEAPMAPPPAVTAPPRVERPAPAPPPPAPLVEEELPAAPEEVEEPTVPCPNCGQPIPFGAAYCPQCGKIIS